MKKTKKKRFRINLAISIALVCIVVLVAIFINNKTGTTQIEASASENLASLSYEEVQEGDEKFDNCDYVQFDAFFLADLDGDEYADKVRGTSSSLDSTETLYFDLNVLTNGYLKEGATITIEGDNVTLKTVLVEDSIISENYISDDTKEIVLNQVSLGTEKLIYGTIKPNVGKDTTKYHSEINKITFSGTHVYVKDDGTTEETDIYKTIYFTVDWYGDVNAYFYETNKTQQQANSSTVTVPTDTTDGSISTTFTLKLRESDMELLLEGMHIYFTVPEILGYRATSVTCSNSFIDYSYDPDTGYFEATRWAVTNDDGVITRNAYASTYSDGYECREVSFTITVTYPYEVYEAGRAEITLYGYNTGYSNDFIESPVTSNTTSTYVQLQWGADEGLTVRPGTYRSYDNQYVISKKIGYSVYNGTSEDEIEQDTYPVRWSVSSNSATDGYVLEEDPSYGIDAFYASSDGSITDMKASDGTALTQNVGIYFAGSTALLRRRWMD